MMQLIVLAALIGIVYYSAKSYTRYIETHPEDDTDLFI